MSETHLETPRPRALPGLLLGILFKPRATLLYLKGDRRRYPSWVMGLLALGLALLPLLVTGQVANTPGAMMMEEAPIVMEGTKPAPDMYLAEGVEQPPAPSAPSVLSFVGVAVGTLATWLIWGSGLYVASVFLGRSSTFGHMAKLAVWCWTPHAVRGLVQSIYIALTKAPIANAGLAGFVMDARTPALFPPGPGQLALASLLGNIDVYQVWHLILLTIGLMAFTQLPLRKAAGATIVLWVVWALLSAIPAVTGGMVGQLFP